MTSTTCLSLKHDPPLSTFPNLLCFLQTLPSKEQKLHSALTPASYQGLANGATEETGAIQPAAGVSPKRQKVTASGTTATELEAEIAAKQAQLAALLRDQSQAGSHPTPGKYNKLLQA